MNSDLFFGGKKYISAKSASLLTGYTTDYIGQLCRSGRIESRRVGRAWYVLEESAKSHKKIFLDEVEENKAVKKTETSGKSRIAEKIYTANKKLFSVGTRSVRLAVILAGFVIWGTLVSALGMAETSKLVSSVPQTLYEVSDEIVDHYSKKLGERYLTVGEAIIDRTYALKREGVTVAKNPALYVVETARSISAKEKVMVDASANSAVLAIANTHKKVLAYISESSRGLSILQESISGRGILTASVIDSPNFINKIGSLVYKKTDKFFAWLLNIPTPEQFAVVVVKAPVPIPTQTVPAKETTKNIIPVQTTKVIERSTVVERIIEKLSPSDITRAEVDLKLQQLNNKMFSEFSKLSSGGNTVINNVYEQIAQSQRIDNLYNTLISNPRITGGSISGTSVGATGLSSESLSVSGASSLSLANILNAIITNSTTTNAFSENLTATNLTVGSLTSTSTITLTNITANSLLATDANGGVIATSTPAFGYFYATSTTATSTVSGNFTVGGANGLYITGDGAGLTFSGLGNHDITAESGTLRLGSNTVIGNIQALNNNINIGTPAVRFKTIYADEVNASTLVGVLSAGNLSAETFSINSDNTTDDTENSYLAFERGTLVPNALLTWDATLDTFDLNQPLFIQTDSATTTITTLDLRGAPGQTASLFNVASSSETSYFNITSVGNVGIGTTTPLTKFHIAGTDGLIIPVGTTAERPSSATGIIRYNSETSQFEGYGTSSWGSLGGVIDVDQDTKITAEDSSGVDNDQLKFFTVNSERMRIDSTGNVGIGTTTPWARLSVAGSGVNDTTPAFAISDLASTTRMVVLNNGNVGIGTTAPGAPLQVNHISNSVINDVSAVFSRSGGDALGTRGVGIVFKDSNNPTITAGIAGIRENAGGNYDGGLAFFTANDDNIPATTFATMGEKMRINSFGNVGIGTTNPTNKLEVVAGTLASTINALKVTGTLDSTVASQRGVSFIITGAGSGAGWDGSALRAELSSGYTGNGYTTGIIGVNNTVGTGTAVATYGTGNTGVLGTTQGVTTGDNAGVMGYAQGGNRNYGVVGVSYVAKDSATNIGVHGLALNTGTSPIQIGGYFGLQATTPTYTSAALIADNGSQTSPIFLARDAGTSVFSIIDGGNVGIGTTGPLGKLWVASGSSGATAPSDTIMGIESNLSTGLTINTPNNKYGIIAWRDPQGTAASLSFDHSTNDMSFWVNGDTRVVIANSGNVGIGTTSPSYKLDVMGGIASYGSSFFGGAITATSTLDVSGLATLTNASTTQLTTTGSTYLATLGGNVGIGTTGPGKKLTVNDNAGTQAMFYGYSSIAGSGAHAANGEILLGNFSGAGGRFSLDASVSEDLYIDNLYDSTSADIQFRTRAAGTPVNAVTIKGSGNVGIGTTNPQSTLSVLNNGTAAATLALYNNNATNLRYSELKSQFSPTDDSFGAGIRFLKESTDANYGSSIGFLTELDSSTQSYGYRMYIKNGNVGIGTTAWGAYASNVRLYVAAAYNQVTAGAEQFRIGESGNYHGLIGYDEDGATNFVFDNSFSSATSAYSFRFANSPVMTILGSGNVGIGTAAPGYLLDVNGASNFSGIMRSTSYLYLNNTTTYEATRIWSSNQTYSIQSLNGTESGYLIGNAWNPTLTQFVGGLSHTKSIVFAIDSDNNDTTDGFYFTNNTGIGEDPSISPLMAIKESGNVGIGTTTPQWLLNPFSSTAPQLSLSAGAGLAQWTMRNAGGNFYLSTTTTDGTATTTTSALTILNSGNVGIGTTAPTALLTLGSSAPAINVDTVDGSDTKYLQLAGGGAGADSRGAFINLYGNELGSSGYNGRLYLKAGKAFTSGLDSSISFATNELDRMVITYDGNVGIGTTAPGAMLDVRGVISIPTQDVSAVPKYIKIGDLGTISETSGGLAYIAGNSVRASDDIANYIETTTGNAGQFMRMRYDTGISFHTNITGAAGTNLIDTTNTRMIIDLSGNVGIGTTAPKGKLNIVLSQDYNAQASTVSLANSFLHLGGGEYGVGRYYLTTYGYSAAMTNPSSYMGAIGVDAGGIGTTALVFGTRDAVSDTSPTERMRIDRAGNVGIGTTTPFAKLSVNPIAGDSVSFVIGSSTGTQLSVSSLGFGTTTLSGLNIGGSATSTSNVGWNITTGCYAVSGVCIGGGSGSYGDTDVNSYIHASTTIPKLYTANTFSALQTFTNASSTLISSTYASSTNAYFGSVGIGTTTPAGTLGVTGNIFVDNTTSSSTFTGNLEILGALKVGTSSIYLNGNATSTFSSSLQASHLNLTSTTATSTFANGISLTGGCLLFNGECLTGGSSLTGTTGQLAYFSGTNTAVGTSTLFITPAGNIGIGTTTPTNSISFSNASDRKIWIEATGDTVAGRALTLAAGGSSSGTAYGGDFLALSQSSLGWSAMAAAPNGNVYAVINGGGIYMQTGGTGDFVTLSQTSRAWSAIAVAPNGNVYATVSGGDIYMQTGGTGNFVALSQTTRDWYGIAAAPDGDVYASVYIGTIYKQTGGTGDFVTLSQTVRNWGSMTASPNGDVYASTVGNDIYIQTGGTGDFTALSAGNRNWTGMAAATNGDIYATDHNSGSGQIYKRTGGIGSFTSLGQTPRYWYAIAVAPNGRAYAAVNGGDIYAMGTVESGTSDLAGGNLILSSGVGKGAGASTISFFTGTTLSTSALLQTASEKMTILGNGNVGIGITAPTQKLSVSGGVSLTGLANGAGTSYLCITLATGVVSTSTSACNPSSIRYKDNVVDVSTNQGLSAVMQMRPVTFTYKPELLVGGSQIGFIAEEMAGIIPEVVGLDSEGQPNNIDYGKLTPVLTKAIQELNTRTLGFYSATTTPSIIVTDSGSVGIGTSTPASKLHVFSNSMSGGVATFTDGNASCTIDPTNSTLTCSSDQRLKKDIQTLNATTTLDKVMSLRPVEYRWNGESSGVVPHQGFIAQEVESIFPEFVTTNVDGKKSIAYTNFIPAMAGAIQAINAKIDSIDARLFNLETLVASSTPTETSGFGFAGVVSGFVDQFETLGAKFVEGIAYFKNILTDKLTVGSTEKPSGITLYDEVTNEPYCLKMRNGAMVSMAGECLDTTNATTTPEALRLPEISINGNNPANISVGDVYSDMGAIITGPTETDKNLGINTFVDGMLMGLVQIDTSIAGTHIVDYVVINDTGTATSTREVVVGSPEILTETEVLSSVGDIMNTTDTIDTASTTDTTATDITDTTTTTATTTE